MSPWTRNVNRNGIVGKYGLLLFRELNQQWGYKNSSGFMGLQPVGHRGQTVIKKSPSGHVALGKHGTWRLPGFILRFANAT